MERERTKLVDGCASTRHGFQVVQDEASQCGSLRLEGDLECLLSGVAWVSVSHAGDVVDSQAVGTPPPSLATSTHNGSTSSLSSVAGRPRSWPSLPTAL